MNAAAQFMFRTPTRNFNKKRDTCYLGMYAVHKHTLKRALSVWVY